MYVGVCTRPDLSYAVNLVSRFMANPCKEHWYALKWILRYIKGAVNKRLVFGAETKLFKQEESSQVL